MRVSFLRVARVLWVEQLKPLRQTCAQSVLACGNASSHVGSASSSACFAMVSCKIRGQEGEELDDGEAIQADLAELTGQRTVPSVWIKGTHLGGNDDTQKALASGDLEKMLA